MSTAGFDEAFENAYAILATITALGEKNEFDALCDGNLGRLGYLAMEFLEQARERHREAFKIE